MIHDLPVRHEWPFDAVDLRIMHVENVADLAVGARTGFLNEKDYNGYGSPAPACVDKTWPMIHPALPI